MMPCRVSLQAVRSPPCLNEYICDSSITDKTQSTQKQNKSNHRRHAVVLRVFPGSSGALSTISCVFVPRFLRPYSGMLLFFVLPWYLVCAAVICSTSASMIRVYFLCHLYSAVSHDCFCFVCFTFFVFLLFFVRVGVFVVLSYPIR